jgi:dipeptidyl aminopeptidase/acylaminoacyl peptidase
MESASFFSENYVGSDVWSFDTVRGTLDRHTFDGQSRGLAIWSPDGTRIAFGSFRSGPRTIYLKTLDSPEAIPLTEGLAPSSWSPDGKEIAFVQGDPETSSASYDVSVVSVDPPHKVRSILKSRFNETHPEFSPDGKWLSYCSDESGRREVYVQPYPSPGRRVQISTDGGCEHVWSKDGKELFYKWSFGDAGAPRGMMSVRIQVSGGEIIPEKPVVIFQHQFTTSGAVVRFYDIAPDGRFLMLGPGPVDPLELNKKIFPSTLRIVLKWSVELDRLLGNKELGR